MKYKQIVTALALAATTIASPAGTTSATSSKGKTTVEPQAAELDLCEKIFSLPTFYKNKDNPIIQEIAFIGRYQGQYSAVDSDQGTSNDWDHRRARLGLKVKLFQDFELKGEILSELNDGGDFYDGITEAYLAYKPNDAFNIFVGKVKPKFSLDWSTSSREIITLERNILINNFGIDYASGVAISGKSGNWSYNTSVTNNDINGDGGRAEFGDLDGGWSYVANVGYDLKDSLGVDKAIIRLDYLHSEHESKDDLLTKFDDSLAASFSVKQGPLAVNTEVLYGTGDGGDMLGVYIMPSYDITKKLQVVARYTYAHSGDDAIRAQRRYERSVPLSGDGSGGEYNAGYLGLNYYFCKHNLKLMSGLEYSTLDGGADGGDFDGWTWTTGVRISW